MDLKLENKVVLLTGGTGGIGKQICLDFLDEGAIVVCAIRNESKFEELKVWLKNQDARLSNVHAMKCDLLSKLELDQMIKEIISNYQRLDVLVNCAGTVVEIPFAMMDESQIDKMLDVNLKSILLTTQAALRPMFLQKEGAIVNVSSITAIRGGRGIVAYASAKAGIDSFTRTLATEVGKKNIRVNTVRPGAIKTEMSKPLEARAEKYVPDAMILGRFGKPSEVSKAVLFLASNETSSYMTGSFMNVDGGYIV